MTPEKKNKVCAREFSRVRNAFFLQKKNCKLKKKIYLCVVMKIKRPYKPSLRFIRTLI